NKMSKSENIIVKFLNKSVIGEILGREYVKKYFNEESKYYVAEMIACIKEQMNKSIQSLKWMSLITKKRALMKLRTFNTKIGYPDFWRNHDELYVLIKNYDNIERNNLLDIICELKIYTYKF